MGIKVVDLAFGGLSDYYEFKTKEMDSLTGAVINIGHYKTEVSIIKEGKLKNVEVLSVNPKEELFESAPELELSGAVGKVNIYCNKKI